ncbi:hypothetical protein LTR91_026289 [Friedmanniomyces endolithicus]|uniref:Uncharacterized protein n=1 Tax=Friedmanniomyces endolithicus TaxID=329885 RepID=A0AAN6GXJ1_9PEZI|nr:hypothetical protein LTR38_014799 [Friedmanniomyces endolithicus]KAK0851431.1 hypothetical protein LTS02_012779 [Friedmanniomyces endolithicus]KAK0877542.1 hypothetical protein LTR87_008673 [Friedmanniomyces endolithicus]KAK0922412.1 hypothetical protein LTR57_007884 [Friedmanniomyces endolithicus]KAK0949638.1 hypothetical protein LTR91_026289 [Friedmanniomyces endolithicus]
MPGNTNSTGTGYAAENYGGSDDYRNVNGGGGYGSPGSNAPNPGPRLPSFWYCCRTPCKAMASRHKNKRQICPCGHLICIYCDVRSMNI